VPPPHRLEPPDQHSIGGLKEEHARLVPTRVKVLDDGRKVLGERTTAHVHNDSHARDRPTRLRAELDHGGDEFRGQVVHDEPAEVLQALGRGAAARTGQPGHHGDFDAGLLRAGLLRVHDYDSVTCS